MKEKAETPNNQVKIKAVKKVIPLTKKPFYYKAYKLFLLLRPKQWVKNLIVFLPLFLSGKIFYQDFFLRNLYAFIALCLLTSAIYIVNDIIDSENDQHHPVKKYRPIASGTISKPFALATSFILLILSLVVGYILLHSEYFIAFQIGYAVMMVLYSVWLKNVGIVDTIIIALGFIFRAFAGAVVIEISVSAMLAVTIIGGALLISFGKRRAEISEINYDNAIEYRPALSVYSGVSLNVIVAGLFAVTFISYVLFCYSFAISVIDYRIVQVLPPLIRNSNWLLLTIPVAFYSLTRYLVNVFKGNIAERPEDLWWQDKALLISGFIWFLMLFLLIYWNYILEIIHL